MINKLEMPKKPWWDMPLDIFAILFNIGITVLAHSILNFIFTLFISYYIVVMKKTKWDLIKAEHAEIEAMRQKAEDLIRSMMSKQMPKNEEEVEWIGGSDNPIILNHWQVHEGEIYGRAINRDNSPTRTGDIKIPDDLKKGDLVVSARGVYFKMAKPYKGGEDE